MFLRYRQASRGYPGFQYQVGQDSQALFCSFVCAYGRALGRNFPADLLSRYSALPRSRLKTKPAVGELSMDRAWLMETGAAHRHHQPGRNSRRNGVPTPSTGLKTPQR